MIRKPTLARCSPNFELASEPSGTDFANRIVISSERSSYESQIEVQRSFGPDFGYSYSIPRFES